MVPAISGWSARDAIKDYCCSERLLTISLSDICHDRRRQSAPNVRIIGDRKHERNLARSLDRDAMRNKPSGLNQHARRSALVEPMALQAARALADIHEFLGHCHVDLGLMGNDFGFYGCREVAEVHRPETLFG